MAVLVIAEVEGQNEELYDAMIAVLGPMLRQANGFIAQGAGPAGPGGDVWRGFEVWESAADATQFFAKYVHPNLPPSVKPRRTLVELHSLVLPSASAPLARAR